MNFGDIGALDGISVCSTRGRPPREDGNRAEGEGPSRKDVLEERAKDRKSAQSQSDELSRPGPVRGSRRERGALLGGQACRRGSRREE